MLDGVELAQRGVRHRHRVAEVVAGRDGEMLLELRDPRADRAGSLLEERRLRGAEFPDESFEVGDRQRRISRRWRVERGS